MTVKNYLVVEFSTENPITVDVIPSNWLIGNTECWWPSRCDAGNLKKIRCDRTLPQPSWGKCVCRILGEFDTFKAAVEGARKAEDTSELENDPILPNKRISKNKKINSDHENDNCLSILRAHEVTATGATNEFPISLLSSPPTNLYMTSPVEGSNLLATVGGEEENNRQIIYVTTEDFLAPVGQTEVTPGTSSNTSSASAPVLRTDYVPTQGFQTTVIKHIAGIEKTLKSLERKLEKITAHLEASKINESDPPLPDFDFSSLPNFPLHSEQSLQEFDNQLELSIEKASFVQYLFEIGGETLNQTVKLIFDRIIDHDLAIGFTFTGKGKEKKPFEIYSNVNYCITGAVKKNKKLAADQKTDVSIRLSVMNHLRFSRAPKTAEEEKN